MPLIFYILVFWHLGALLILEGLSLPELTSHDSSASALFVHKVTNPEPLSTCPNHPKAKYQAPPVPQNLLRLSTLKLLKPQTAYPDSPTPSCGNQDKGSCPPFPLTLPAFLPTQVRPHMAPEVWQALLVIWENRVYSLPTVVSWSVGLALPQ